VIRIPSAIVEYFIIPHRQRAIDADNPIAIVIMNLAAFDEPFKVVIAIVDPIAPRILTPVAGALSIFRDAVVMDIQVDKLVVFHSTQPPVIR